MLLKLRIEIDVIEKSKDQQTSCQWNISNTNEPGFY